MFNKNISKNILDKNFYSLELFFLPDLTAKCLFIFIGIQAFDPFLFCQDRNTQKIDRIYAKDIHKCFIPYKYIILISFHILIIIDFIQYFNFYQI